jgi:hypothetical protein
MTPFQGWVRRSDYGGAGMSLMIYDKIRFHRKFAYDTVGLLALLALILWALPSEEFENTTS